MVDGEEPQGSEEDAAQAELKEKKLQKLKKSQEVLERYSKVVKSESVFGFSGYDHIEGGDFDKINDMIDEGYKKNLSLQEPEDKKRNKDDTDDIESD